MGMRINGVDGDFSVPRVVKRYKFAKFEASMTATMSDGTEKTVDIRAALTAAWKGVGKRSNQKSCNDYFSGLFGKKTLHDILAQGDITLHRLEPKEGYDYSVLPDANTAGRDIGLDPTLFFDPEADALICTLIHELAHVGGASTDSGAPLVQAHAAEQALLSCSCKKQYRKDVVGRIQGITADSGQRYA